jgi:hypothetical protein
MQVHWKASSKMDGSLLESVHVAPLRHGMLAHSSTSALQLPPLKLKHSASEPLLLPVHTPFEKPAVQTQV